MKKTKRSITMPAEQDGLTGEVESVAIYTARNFNFGVDPQFSPPQFQRRALSLAGNIREGRERKLVFAAVLVSLLPPDLREVGSAEFDRIFYPRYVKKNPSK